MAKKRIKAGSVNVTVYINILDSSVTDGSGLTGLVFNSAGLQASYVRNQAAASTITLATQTAAGAHSDGGFVEVDASGSPGLYRLDLPDAAVASGVNSVVVSVNGATDAVPIYLELQLDDTSEPTSVPAADATLEEKINYIYLFTRNKLTQTATQQQIFADDGTTSIGTATISDDGTTTTKGEFA